MNKGNHRKVLNDDGDIEFVPLTVVGWTPLWNLPGYMVIRTGEDFVELRQERADSDMDLVKVAIRQIWMATKGPNCFLLHISAIIRQTVNLTCTLEIGYAHCGEIQVQYFTGVDERYRQNGILGGLANKDHPKGGWSKHKTEFHGVFSYGERFRVWVTIAHKSKYGGTFDDAVVAAHHADELMKSEGVSCQRLNFPSEQ